MDVVITQASETRFLKKDLTWFGLPRTQCFRGLDQFDAFSQHTAVSAALHAAPALVAAIHFQLKRALLHLLTSEADAFVAIEAPWDVSVLAADGKLVKAEEDKNSIVGVSQLSDRHESLWKSLRNYTAARVQGRITGKDSKLTICTNVTLTGGLSSQFIDRTWEESDEWVTAQRESLLNAANGPSDAIAPHVNYIRDHHAEFLDVLRSLEVIDGSAVTKDGATSQEIFRLLRSPVDEQDYVLESLMGWLGERVADAIATGQTAVVSVASFNTRYREELNRGRQLRLLRRLDKEFAAALTPERKRRHRGEVFQQQLHWVGFDRSPDTLEQAVEDFLRYEVAVTAYAEDGDIPKEQFRKREDEIQDQWRSVFNRESFDLPPETSAQATAGRNVYHECSKLSVPLDGVAACESYLTRGALHHLANEPEEDPRVGWHPKFRSLARDRVQSSA